MAKSTRIKLSPSFWNHPYGVPFSDDVLPSTLFLKNKHYLILDIESQKLADEVGGWDHVDKLGVSVACVYDSATDQFISYLEKDLPKMFELCYDRLIIGYNIRGFDLKVLEPYGLKLKGLDIFDLMYDVQAISKQRYLKLESIAQATLGTGKSADGKLAVEWYKKGEIQKIIDYCMQDVKVTRDVFQYGRQHGLIRSQRGSENVIDVPVQWN